MTEKNQENFIPGKEELLEIATDGILKELAAVIILKGIKKDSTREEARALAICSQMLEHHNTEAKKEIGEEITPEQIDEIEYKQGSNLLGMAFLSAIAQQTKFREASEEGKAKGSQVMGEIVAGFISDAIELISKTDTDQQSIENAILNRIRPSSI